MLKVHQQNFDLDAPLPLGEQANEWPGFSEEAEGAVDVAAAYLLRQVEDGGIHLRVATGILARRAPDFELAFAHVEAARRALEQVDFYLSNVALECNSGAGVVAARIQLSKQHRETLSRLRSLCKRHKQYVSAIGEAPALV